MGPGNSSMLHLSKLLAVLRAALHLQQICCCPGVQWQRLEQLLLHEVKDAAGISSGNVCSLLWQFVRYAPYFRHQSLGGMHHAFLISH